MVDATTTETPCVTVCGVISTADADRDVALVLDVERNGRIALKMSPAVALMLAELIPDLVRRAKAKHPPDNGGIRETVARVVQSFAVGRLAANRNHLLLVMNPDSAIEERTMWPLPVAAKMGHMVAKEALAAGRVNAGLAAGLPVAEPVRPRIIRP